MSKVIQKSFADKMKEVGVTIDELEKMTNISSRTIFMHMCDYAVSEWEVKVLEDTIQSFYQFINLTVHFKNDFEIKLKVIKGEYERQKKYKGNGELIELVKINAPNNLIVNFSMEDVLFVTIENC